MVQYERHDRVHLPERLYHRNAHLRVLLDQFHFFFGQFPGTEEEFVGQGDLADIVQHRSQIQVMFFLSRRVRSG